MHNNPDISNVELRAFNGFNVDNSSEYIRTAAYSMSFDIEGHVVTVPPLDIKLYRPSNLNTTDRRVCYKFSIKIPDDVATDVKRFLIKENSRIKNSTFQCDIYSAERAKERAKTIMALALYSYETGREIILDDQGNILSSCRSNNHRAVSASPRRRSGSNEMTDNNNIQRPSTSHAMPTPPSYEDVIAESVAANSVVELKAQVAKLQNDVTKFKNDNQLLQAEVNSYNDVFSQSANRFLDDEEKIKAANEKIHELEATIRVLLDAQNNNEQSLQNAQSEQLQKLKEFKDAVSPVIDNIYATIQTARGDEELNLLKRKKKDAKRKYQYEKKLFIDKDNAEANEKNLYKAENEFLSTKCDTLSSQRTYLRKIFSDIKPIIYKYGQK